VTDQKVNNVLLVTSSAAQKCWLMGSYVSFMTRWDSKQ